MNGTPFGFAWHVDRDGYEIHVEQESAGLAGRVGFEVLVARGGRLRPTSPLDDESLWLRFAETCKDMDGVMLFTKEFGLLGASPERLDRILETAAHIRRISQHLDAGDRLTATRIFDQNIPTMKAAILWYSREPERFHYRLIPVTLRDALLHQAGEAITGNRRFRRCRNEGCSNWFRLGPNVAPEDGRRQTITIRREFCSDRCRVASARRQKRELAAHA